MVAKNATDHRGEQKDFCWPPTSFVTGPSFAISGGICSLTEEYCRVFDGGGERRFAQGPLRRCCLDGDPVTASRGPQATHRSLYSSSHPYNAESRLQFPYNAKPTGEPAVVLHTLRTPTDLPHSLQKHLDEDPPACSQDWCGSRTLRPSQGAGEREDDIGRERWDLGAARSCLCRWDGDCLGSRLFAAAV